LLKQGKPFDNKKNHQEEKNTTDEWALPVLNNILEIKLKASSVVGIGIQLV